MRGERFCSFKVQYPSLIAENLQSNERSQSEAIQKRHILQVDHDRAALRDERLHDLFYLTNRLANQTAMAPNRRNLDSVFGRTLYVTVERTL